jgi:hypothetical protein
MERLFKMLILASSYLAGLTMCVTSLARVWATGVVWVTGLAEVTGLAGVTSPH